MSVAMTDERQVALEAVQFNSALTPEDVWSPVSHHVDGLHTAAAASLLRDVGAARKSSGASPLGVVLQGERGVGKTHMLRWLRQRVQEQEGYFFLVKLLDGGEFWHSAVHGVVDSLYAGQGDQLTPFLRRLAKRAGLGSLDENRVAGMLPLARTSLDGLVAGLQQLDRQVWQDCQNTLRALVLYRASDLEVQEVGYGYLAMHGDVDDAARAAWGFRPGTRSRQLVLRDLSRLLALTGPTVMAIDQIDSSLSAYTGSSRGTETPDDATAQRLADLASGLMELREGTRRTLSVVACLPPSWRLIRKYALTSAVDRFRVTTLSGAMPDDEIPRAIVRQHLGGLFAEIGYEPPHDTWPVAAAAFTDGSTRDLTPRKLLQRVDAHVRTCLDTGVVAELTTFGEVPGTVPIEVVDPDPDLLGELDRQFQTLRAAADVDAPLDRDAEDLWMPRLLGAGLTAYVTELGEAGQEFSVDHIDRKKPPVHARLRRTLHEQSEDEAHVCFRAIAHPNARAVQTRLGATVTEAGLRMGPERRALVLVRNTGWPTGKVTAETVVELRRMGAVTVGISEDDLRTFSALQAMQRPQPRGFVDWLVARRPASSTALFRAVLDERPTSAVAVSEEGVAGAAGAEVGGGSSEEGGVAGGAAPPGAGADAARGSARPRRPSPRPRRASVAVGRSQEHGHDVLVELEALRKHTAVFAGSGSGKTVLLRRLVEECALQGVSAIVLDPNNDLSRLGDAWPSPPTGWFAGDEARAAEYLEHTEVVVWTPGRAKGRPLAFQPLPDFAPVLGDEDEFRLAVDSAVASLAPRAGLTKAKLEQGKAVLREVLEHYALDGGSTLAGFVELLSGLPDGISGLRTGPKLAAEMAEQLHAAMINDPLFGGTGQTVDPSVLLTPQEGRRARISVISFVGLPDDAQRQGFVNQLQMALFSWVKANPAGDRPLGGLFVMDEAQTFAPSGALTACTQSTISLASQARKYGLGLVFATQAPKGLHNRISGNAATQFFGFLNAPAQIAAATELAQAKGGRVDDISRLRSGQFYVAGEGLAFERVAGPMCLSHHPASPPTTEEVVERAARR